MALQTIETKSGWENLYSPYTGRIILGVNVDTITAIAEDESVLFSFCDESGEFDYINPIFLKKAGLPLDIETDEDGEVITPRFFIEQTSVEGGIVYLNHSAFGESYCIGFGRLD